MKTRSLLYAIILILAASPLIGHCDTMRGPVVAAAKIALEKADVTPVLKWVPLSKESEIRDAFAKTLAARASSPQAREVADAWFFETVVRVHRQSEGEPFTGLKDTEPEAGIELADAAIDRGSVDEVQKQLASTLRDRFAAVQEAKKHANDSVEAGRQYVRAYVEFIHFVERMHGEDHRD